MIHDYYEIELTVTADDIDEQGHANNVAYVAWMQDAAIAHSTANGWGPVVYEQFGSGFVVRSHFIEYHRPTFDGDRLTVRTWVSSMSRATSLRRYRIFRTDSPEEIVARGETRWAFICYATRQPRRMPKELIESFAIIDEAL